MDAKAITDIRDISVHFMVRLPRNDKRLKLEKFEILNVGDIEVDFRGRNFGFLDWIISRLTSSVANLIKNEIRGSLGDAVKDVLNPIVESAPTDAAEVIINSFSGY